MKGNGVSGLKEQASVVLVHGAWADGSSWNDVIGPLLSKGFHVVAAPIPLTSLQEDIAALDRVLERTDGPLVLVAHAYAGAVIASTISERIRSLVFIAALAPAEGETVADVFYREKPHPQAPQLAPDAHGLIWMPHEGFNTARRGDPGFSRSTSERPQATSDGPSGILACVRDSGISLCGCRSNRLADATPEGGRVHAVGTPLNPTKEESCSMSQSVAIVTGSSSGIGRATAIRLSSDFSTPVLVARGARQLEEGRVPLCRARCKSVSRTARTFSHSGTRDGSRRIGSALYKAPSTQPPSRSSHPKV